ncbi:MAG: hypothetical protein EG828_03515 [Deltaproteobacteria bacterium]|nr:hypothetical protein [Deltaproteobacteria bacterium]
MVLAYLSQTIKPKDRIRMNISEELRRLADLLREGHLTEEEFAEAKKQVLSQGNSEPKTLPDAEMTESLPRIEEKTYHSNRWTSGNTFFPDSLVLVSDGIVFRKRRIFGSNEQHITYKAIASIHVTSGLFFSTISIETSGGSQPIIINGLWKSEAKEIQSALSQLQRQAKR